MTDMLPGLDLRDAQRLLRDAGIACEVKRYLSSKPYENADSWRVVRAIRREDGSVELVACHFKTEI
ncbi:MAG: hypothetical protein ACOYJB_06330 [Christensenellaceae bacterium]|jgi:hypothetical protein